MLKFPVLLLNSSVTQLTMYQLFFFTDLWKQMLECFFVLYETLKKDDTAKIRTLDNRNLVAKQGYSRIYSICAGGLRLLQACVVIKRL